jgi:hypothetical protein
MPGKGHTHVSSCQLCAHMKVSMKQCDRVATKIRLLHPCLTVFHIVHSLRTLEIFWLLILITTQNKHLMQNLKQLLSMT